MTQSHLHAAVPADQHGSYPALAGMAPATTGRRVAGRLLDTALVALAVIVGIALGLGSFMSTMSDYNSSSTVNAAKLNMAIILPYAIPLVFIVAEYFFWAFKGNHIGGYLLGLRNVDVTTGKQAGAQSFGKNLLMGVTSSLTLGIMPLICCFGTVAAGTNRNIYDRWLNAMVIDTKAGRAPNARDQQDPAASATAQTAVATARPAIQPVAMAFQGKNIQTTPVAPPSVSANQPKAPMLQSSSAGANTAPPPPGSQPIASPPLNAPLLIQAPAAASAPVLDLGDPFEAKTAVPNVGVIDVPKPGGAGALIESTPLSGARAKEPETAPAISRAPMVIREMAPAAEVAGVSSDVGQSIDETVISEIGTPSEPRAAELTELVVLLDNSVRLASGQVTLLGRNPIEVANLEDAVVMPIGDDMQLSKTHLAVGVDNDGLWIMDLNSTNGSYIVGTDGAAAKAQPATRTPVPAGAVVRFGSHTIRASR